MKARIVERLRGTAPAADPESVARSAFPQEAASRLFPATLTPAAVIVGLAGDRDDLRILLTRRTDHLRDHPGQISLPGGRIEPADEGPLGAALRETSEELGVDAGFLEVVGYLPPHAVVTGFVVTPVVAFLPPGLNLHPDPCEVAEVFEVPLAFLLKPANVIQATRRVRDVEFAVCEYHYGPRRIWGATAQILQSFCEIITKQ